jgi:hypothetical protein
MAPVYLSYHDQGYGADWCHVSAKHHAMRNGGRRVHGWALWQFPNGVVGDFHSVWENPDKTLIDLTPPKNGKNQVLFVCDRVTDIYLINDIFALPTNRMSPPNSPYWWEGKPTADTVWGLLPQNPHFVKYCAGLSFSANEFETSSAFG